MDEQKINGELIVSEVSLAYMPKRRFTADSWSVFDEFMEYAIDIFGAMVASLLTNGYLRIAVEENKSFKLLGVPISTSVNYIIELVKKPEEDAVVGWLEGKVFKQFNWYTHIYIDDLIKEVLKEVFDGDHKINNPGKKLTLEILANQRMDRYEFDHGYSWLSEIVTVWHTKNSYAPIKPKLLVHFSSESIDINKLRKIIASQFRKFRNFD